MKIIPFERLEKRYYLKEDIVQSKIAIFIAVFFCIIFSVGDYLNLGLSNKYYMTMISRIAFILFSIIVLSKLKQLNCVKQHNKIIFHWGIFFIGLILFVNILRQVNNLNFTYLDNIIVLALYLIMPNSLYKKSILAGILTLGDIGIIIFLKDPPDHISLVTIFITYIIANILGGFFSNRLSKFRQNQYRILRQERNLRAELEKVAYLDYLTGAYNRRKFFELGDVEFSRFKRYGSLFSIIMLDLDYFKRLNDEYGHEAGDVFLKEFVNAILKYKRIGDILGRLGGEEFAVILPETNLEFARQAANRILSFCGEAKVPYYSQCLYTTVSIGITEVEASDRTFNDTMKRADNALYKAKSDGRNRIIVQ